VNLNSAASLTGVFDMAIYCRKTNFESQYPSTPAGIFADPAATSVTLTGLAPGRHYTCRAHPRDGSGRDYMTNNEVTFQTASHTATNYNGPLLVRAFGDVNAYVASQRRSELTWRAFTGATGGANPTQYSVFRVIKGGTFQTSGVNGCTGASGHQANCRVCTASGPGAKTCTDLHFTAYSPNVYDYLVVQHSTDGLPEELALPDTAYRIRVPAPPANMVLVHRASANFEMCQLMGRASDPLNHQRCEYSGAGNVPYAIDGAGNTRPALSSAYYDLGYDFFIDRHEAGCNWTPSASGGRCGESGASANCTRHAAGITASLTSSYGVDGNVFYGESGSLTMACRIKQGGVWYGPNDAQLTPSSRALMMTNAGSSQRLIPPLVYVTQASAAAFCAAVSDPNYGPKRLPRRREQIVASAWPRLFGEPGALTTQQIDQIENGNSSGGYTESHATAGNYFCHNAHFPAVPSDPAGFVSPAAGYEGTQANPGNGSNYLRLGSLATSRCVSRFGAQDLIGNVEEWTSDQVGDCTASEDHHTCQGKESTVDLGNRDLAGFAWDGVQGPGGSQMLTSYHSLNWMIQFGGGGGWVFPPYFSAPLGLHRYDDDGGQAQSASAFTGTGMENDAARWVRTNIPTGAGVRGGIIYGKSGTAGTNGRMTMSFLNRDFGSSTHLGFRCVLPVED
jgi:hypothetical protein